MVRHVSFFIVHSKPSFLVKALSAIVRVSDGTFVPGFNEVVSVFCVRFVVMYEPD